MQSFIFKWHLWRCRFVFLRIGITRLKIESLRRYCRLVNALIWGRTKICGAETKRNLFSVVPRKTYSARLPNRNLYKDGEINARQKNSRLIEMNPSPLLSLEVGHFVWQDTAKEYVQRIYRPSRAFNFGRFAVFLLCFVVSYVLLSNKG